MRVSVVAGLIIAVHVAVIGSVVMTQGCATTQRGADSTVPDQVEPPAAPVMPPSTVVLPPPQPVVFPTIQPPAAPAPLKTSVAAENIYVVKPGDSLSKIAAAHGVKTAELKELNQIADANKIRAGQKLVLPDHSKPSQSQPAEKAAAPAKAAAKEAAGGTYEVKSGDSLSKIAAAHGVKVADLMAANKITDANKIRAGQKLAIPGAKAEEKKESAQKEEQAAAPTDEYRADAGTPLQVRELPPPSAIEPLPPSDTVRPGESTEPVAGSSPLVPHNGAPA